MFKKKDKFAVFTEEETQYYHATGFRNKREQQAHNAALGAVIGSATGVLLAIGMTIMKKHNESNSEK